MPVRLNFTMDDDVYERLKREVPPRSSARSSPPRRARRSGEPRSRLTGKTPRLRDDPREEGAEAGGCLLGRVESDIGLGVQEDAARSHKE
jgi:hypothetical protein